MDFEVKLESGATDEEGWTEVLLPDEVGQGSLVLGVIRVVADTQGTDNEWWDARVYADPFPDGRLQERRFINRESAIFGLASRHFQDADARRALGW